MALPKKRPKRARPHKPPATLTHSETSAEHTQTQPDPVQYEPEMIEDISVLMNHLTKAISHLSFDQGRIRHLLELPQEIQDIIFDFAYPAIEGFKITTKDIWDESEREERGLRGRSYTRRPFPTPIVSSFLISKKFFISAAKAFVRNQTINCGDRLALLRSPDCLLIAKFVQKAILHLFYFICAYPHQSFPASLKHVTVQVRSTGFDDCIGPKFAWEELFNASDLRAIVKYYKLDNILGLKKIQLLPGRHPYAKSQDHRSCWTSNVSMQEGYIKKRVTKPNPRPTSTTLRNAAALYPGSSVSAADSGKLEEEATDVATRPRKLRLTDLELYDLPNNVEDFKTLLDQDGDTVLELIARLKWNKRMNGSYTYF